MSIQIPTHNIGKNGEVPTGFIVEPKRTKKTTNKTIKTRTEFINDFLGKKDKKQIRYVTKKVFNTETQVFDYKHNGIDLELDILLAFYINKLSVDISSFVIKFISEIML